MPRIAPRFIDELLARADISDVVGTRIALKQQGRELSARCPFHDERSPSFYVSPQKQFFHCFGCGAHGNAIGFVMRYDGLEYVDAIEVLSQQLGLQVQYENAGKRDDLEFDQYYALMSDAARWFQDRLMHEPEAQRYLDRRGINSHSRDRFLLGYAPQAAMKLMHDLGTTAERRKALSKLGLVGTARGEDTAKFFQRVMFPIRDRRGRSIAFGGRVLDSGEPKYLNSPESPLFHKGRQLYGLFEARQAHNKLARLLVVEGYMDVIMLAQHGLTESVATLGTATSRDHAETLFRTVSDVYFCFDGDRAGRSAAWRALTQVLPRLTEGRQAFFLFLPEGEDPDSLVQSEGKQGFEERLRGALPLSSYLFQELRSQSDLGTLEGRAKLVSQVRPLLSSAPDSAFRDLLLLELEKLSGTKVHLTANNESVPPSPSTRYRAAPARTLIRLLLSYVLAQPDIALKAPGLERLEGLERPGVGLLIKLCELVKARPGLNTASMLAALESAQLADTESLEALSKLAMSDPPGEPEAWEQDFLQGLQKLLAEVAKQRIDELRAQMEHEPLSAKQAEELRRLLLESKPRR